VNNEGEVADTNFHHLNDNQYLGATPEEYTLIIFYMKCIFRAYIQHGLIEREMT